jgi:PAS domain S-box-containing protein
MAGRMPDAVVWVCTPSGEQIEADRSWGAFTGQTAIDSGGRGWLEAVSPDDRPLVLALFGGGGSWSDETAIRVRHHDGTYRWLGLQRSVRPASDRFQEEWIIVGFDVTGSRRAEIERRWVLAAAHEARIEAVEQADRARSSEAKLRAVFSALAEGIVLVNANGQIEEVNPSFVRDFETPGLETGLSRTPFSVGLRTSEGRPLPEEDHPIRVALRSGRSVRNVEVQVETSHGIEWRVFCAEPVRDEQDQLLGVVASCFDITEGKLFAEALRESEQRYRMMFEASPHPMWVLDANTLAIIDVNAAAVEQYRYSRQEFRELHLQDLVHAGQHLAMQHALEVAASGVTDSGIRQHLRADGTGFVAEITSHFVRVGARPLIVQLAQDVTERVRFEQEMANMNVELEQRVAQRTVEVELAIQAKSQFVANMSHELRTPLNSIIGFADVLKEGMAGPLAGLQQKFVEDICSAGKHLHSLINDVLDLAKVESGRYELELEECLVQELLETATLVLREQLSKRGIRCEVKAGLDTVWLDKRKMKQVFLNLLSNAAKFSPDHSRVLLRAWPCPLQEVAVSSALPSRLLPLPTGAWQEFVAFAVEDFGPGIPADQLDGLFTPFTQVKGIKSHDGDGTGLGLSLVAGLVHLHGGTVGVESEVGRGTRFVVWIPRRRAHSV